MPKNKSETVLKRGDVTTVSIPTSLKARLEEIKGVNQSFADLLADIFRDDVIDQLESFRGPDDSLGDVIKRLTNPETRSSEELEYFLQSARQNTEQVTNEKITVELDG